MPEFLREPRRVVPLNTNALIMEALGSAPKPLTEDQALAISLKAMEGQPENPEQFKVWFKRYGKYLTESVNGL